MKNGVTNRLAEVRKQRGVAASEIAGRAGVSRQTIYAMEAGTYVPNTEVSLRLARALDVSVEELFSLESDAPAGEPVEAEILSSESPIPHQAVRVCRVGPRWVGVPVTAFPYYLPEADGIVRESARARGRASLEVFARDEAANGKRLIIAGCDPAMALLAGMVERSGRVEVVPAPAASHLALSWLRDGKVHIAGSHLKDRSTGEFNLPQVRKIFPDDDFHVFTFAVWEEGLVVADGNPKSLRKIEDLVRKDVRIVNREPGSGSRALLDGQLNHAGIAADRVHGYDKVAPGHLAAAYSVMSGEADVCVATQSAARAFGLDFLPLHAARYDLVIRKQTAELTSVKELLDVLQRSALRRRLETLAGYDTSRTGAMVA
jgi:molybdate-binding protein/DNA-binding XRE family transcriptional regulator